MFLRFLLLSTAVGAASFLSHTGVYAQTVFIHRSDVLIIASGLTDPAGGTAVSPFPGQVVNPVFDPIVRTARETGRDHEISIDVPDMDPTRNGPRAGIQEGIAEGANVTVIFPQRAGIKNPTLSGGVLVDVSTSPGGPAAAVGLTMQPDTPGAAAEYQITFVAPADIPSNSGTITIILDEDVQLPGVPEEPDEVEQEADLSVTRSGLPGSVSVGSTVSYGLTVSNSGPSDATAVVLTEILPPGVRVVSATPGQGMCEIANTTVSCRLGSVDSDEEVVVSLTLLAGPSPAGDFAITGNVTGKESDPNSGNNQVTANIGILALPTPTPTVTSVPTFTPTATPGPTATPVPTPNLAPTNMPTPTATPVPTPTATAAPTSTLPPDIPSSGTSEAPLRRQPSGGFCRFGDVSAAAGAANLLLLLAPLAAISVYRRLRS
jgi:uncharacterized repeat protein (TIGR01451 family)